MLVLIFEGFKLQTALFEEIDAMVYDDAFYPGPNCRFEAEGVHFGKNIHKSILKDIFSVQFIFDNEQAYGVHGPGI